MTREEKTRKFNQRSPEKRKMILDSMPKVERKKFIKDLRAQAVQDFWNNERKLIKQGKCTRLWTPEQAERILNISEKTGKQFKNAKPACEIDEDGKAYKPNGKFISYQGHHMLNVKQNPIYSGFWRNIQALTRDEHIKGVHVSEPETRGYHGVDGHKSHKFNSEEIKSIESEEIYLDHPPVMELSEETKEYIKTHISTAETADLKNSVASQETSSATKPLLEKTESKEATKEVNSDLEKAKQNQSPETTTNTPETEEETGTASSSDKEQYMGMGYC